jgi:glutathione S-transferase
MLKLYTFPESINAQKVRIVLEEKRIPYTKIHVDLSTGAQFQPAFRKLSPYGVVPVLDDDGLVIYESTIINEYLDEKFAVPPLMPKNPIARARARLLEDYADSVFFPHRRTIFVGTYLVPKEKRDQRAIEESRSALTRELERLDSELEGRDFLAGEFSLADVAFIPTIATLGLLGLAIDPRHANILRWLRRVQERPSFRVIAMPSVA